MTDEVSQLGGCLGLLSSADTVDGDGLKGGKPAPVVAVQRMAGPTNEEQQHEQNGQVAGEIEHKIARLIGAALIITADFQPVENEASYKSSQRQRTQRAHLT